MLQTVFPNLSTLATICLALPVSTASVERSFSRMKLIKNRLQNHLSESSISYLMKIAIETPDRLSDDDLDNIISVRSRKHRTIIV